LNSLNPTNKSPLVAAIGLILLAVGAHGATFNITDVDVAGLKAAIIRLNHINQDDTSNLASAGTYYVTGGKFGTDGLPVIATDNRHSLVVSGADLPAVYLS